MDFNTFCKIDEIMKRHTNSYAIGNNVENLRIEVRAHVDNETKEYILNDLDLELLYGMNFSHEYEDGLLVIQFWEVEKQLECFI